MSARYRTRYEVVPNLPASMTMVPERAEKPSVDQIDRNVAIQLPGGHRSARKRSSAQLLAHIDIAIRADFDNGNRSVGAR